MHKIYEDEGQYYFVRRLPQKLLTSVLTVVIDLIIRNLSLSERNIIKIKRESDMNKTIMLSNKVYKVLKIKFSIFFIDSSNSSKFSVGIFPYLNFTTCQNFVNFS